MLLPGERVPLHVFEPRYRELIGECIEQDGEFGLVLAEDESHRAVGTRARVVEVLERFDDGRLDVVVEGGDRFRVTEATEGRAFLTALAEPLEDDDATAPSASHVDEALTLFRQLRELVESDVDDPDDSTPLSFGLAARVDFGPAAKQQLLETTSERGRLRLLRTLLGRAVEKTRAERVRRELAARNGRPPDIR